MASVRNNALIVQGCVASKAIALSLLLCAGFATHAQDYGVIELMGAMASATEKLDYDGVFIYQRDTHIGAMRIVHKYDGNVERERLISLTGPQREVIRDGQRVTCFFADDREVMVERIEPRDFHSLGLDGPLDYLAESYEFKLLGRDRVAGRDTILVSILPKQANRYGYQLWIDNEFKLLLKSVVLDRGGQQLEQVQFVQIAIAEELSNALLETEIEGAGFTWHMSSDEDNNAAGVVATSGWMVNWLPAGFQMRNHKVQSMPESDMPVSHMVYSDGLAMVSIFVEQLVDNMQPVQGYSSMGAVNAFSRVSDNHQITVVGEIPLPTVRQIASSVEHQ